MVLSYAALLGFLVALRQLVYKNIDYKFDRVIHIDETSAWIDAGFYKYKLDKERCYLAIIAESHSGNWEARPIHEIVLVRNEQSFWRRLFKNKIKLGEPAKKYQDLQDKIVEFALALDLPYTDYLPP